ncbi:hypothetical protein R6Q57_019991 [Mikania cordata]
MTSGYNVTDLVQEAQIRWLKPGEILFILQNFDEKQLTNEPPQKPSSGSLFLFNKRVLRFFRKDGHNWRRKRDGRTVGEAHERLKVGNVEALNCYYAHGELNPNFQRRSYWMLNPGRDHIVLVHYRDITMGSNSCASQFTKSAATFSKLSDPYDDTSSPSSIEINSDVVIQSNGTGPFSVTQGIEEISGSPNFNVDQALRRIEEQMSLDEDNLKDFSAYYRANEISNESGFSANEQNYGGMQDVINNFASEPYPGEYVGQHQCQKQSQGELANTSQQTLLWDDVLKHDVNAVGDESQLNYVYPSDRNGVLLPQPRRDPVAEQEKYNSRYTGANNNSSVLLPHELEDIKFPAYTPARNLSESYPDFCSTMFDQGRSRLTLESDSSLTIAQEQKFAIHEIAPEWGYASEPTKVLIIGTFTRDLSNRQWYCMFGENEVPAEIIQEGVLCCYAPTHLPGKVTLCITSGNQESCSEIREFEYCDKPNNYMNNTGKKSKSSEELLLLVRFMQVLLSGQEEGKITAGEEDSWSQAIEALLDGSLDSSDAIDWLLEEILKDKLQQWLSSSLQNKNGVTSLSKREQGIIHMVSGLGFGWALNPILKSGVGVNFRDINGWTALHWAARFGREKMVAELLASGAFAGAVTDPSQRDPAGQTPASIAATCGHKGLAGYLSEVSLTSHPSLQLQQSELSRSSADIEAETAAVNGISKLNIVASDDLSLKDTLAAVRNATLAAARIQSAFRAHSFRKRQLKESHASRDEYAMFLGDIEGLTAASKLTFRNGNYHNAALSIQKKYRAWKGRKDFLALRQKVVKIQAHVRGHQVRRNYKAFCWAVSVAEKIVLRWRRKGVGLRGYKQEVGALNESEDEDIVRVFRKEKVDVSIDEAVSRVLSMMNSQSARQQYRRMLQKYRQAKAEREILDREAVSTSPGNVMNM